MKSLTTLALGMAFLGLSALSFADDGQPVKQVNFNKAQNSLAVQLEDGSNQNFDANDLLIRLDAKAQHASLIKGMHKYYLVFSGVDMLHDVLH